MSAEIEPPHDGDNAMKEEEEHSPHELDQNDINQNDNQEQPQNMEVNHEPLQHEANEQQLQHETNNVKLEEEQQHDPTAFAESLPSIPPIAETNTPHHHSSNGNPPLRRGKWTPEETTYANRLIQEFRRGTLDLSLPPQKSLTLREFLSKTLRCDPMRITKKFEGEEALRKVVYKPNSEGVDVNVVRSEIRLLEREFLERLSKTKSTSSQAVADRALLDCYQRFNSTRQFKSDHDVGVATETNTGNADLIDLFCHGIFKEYNENDCDDNIDGGMEGYEMKIMGQQQEKLQELKRKYHVSANNVAVTNSSSLQRNLLMHLQQMQQLIHGHGGKLSEFQSPPVKKFKTSMETAAAEAETASSPEFNYNAVVANLLSVQRMIMDNKHKLYDLEFSLCQSQVMTSNNDGEGVVNNVDQERKREVMEEIKSEVKYLQGLKCEIEREIESKYEGVKGGEKEVNEQV